MHFFLPYAGCQYSNIGSITSLPNATFALLPLLSSHWEVKEEERWGSPRGILFKHISPALRFLLLGHARFSSFHEKNRFEIIS